MFDVGTTQEIGKELRDLADKFDDFSMDEDENDDNVFEINNDKLTSLPHTISTTTDTDHIINAYARSNSVNKESRRSSFGSRRHSSLGSTSDPLLPRTTHCSNITELPYELLGTIISYLDLKTIFTLRSTCKLFYDLCSDEYLFKKLDLHPYWHLV